MGGYDGVPQVVYKCGNAQFVWDTEQYLREFAPEMLTEPEDLVSHYKLDEVLRKQFQQTPIHMCMIRKINALNELCEQDGSMKYCNNLRGIRKFLTEFEDVVRSARPVPKQCIYLGNIGKVKKLLEDAEKLVEQDIERNLESLMQAEQHYAEASEKVYNIFKLLNNLDVERYVASLFEFN